MKKVSLPDRILFLITGHVAGFEIVKGLEGFDLLPAFYFTLAFGVLLLACLLLVLFGFKILNSSSVIIITTFLPLCFSLGLVAKHQTNIHACYLVFSVMGLISIILSQNFTTKKTATIVLAFFHGIAGLLIVILPIIFAIKQILSPQVLLIGVGGACIGIVGLMFMFLKLRPSRALQNAIDSSFALLLLLMTTAFVLGMRVV